MTRLLLAVLLLAACGGPSSPARLAPQPPVFLPSSAATATPTPSGEIAPTPPVPITLSDRGSLSKYIKLAQGAWRIDWEARGSQMFQVTLNAEKLLWIADAAAPTEGSTTIRVAGGNYLLTVGARDLEWSLTFSQGE